MNFERSFMVNFEYKKTDTELLIAMAHDGDMKALEEIIRRIQKNVFSMFNYLTESRQDTADLTQEALIKMARGIKNLKDVKLFKSWLNHIVTNVFYDYTRKHKPDKNIEHNDNKLLELKDKIGCEPGEKCFFSEIDKVVKAALLNLPETHRIVIVLREFEGLSYEDISKLTNTSLGTVKSRISRARLKLQDELKEFI